MSLLRSYLSFCAPFCYKHFAPNGAKTVHGFLNLAPIGLAAALPTLRQGDLLPPSSHPDQSAG